MQMLRTPVGLLLSTLLWTVAPLAEAASTTAPETGGAVGATSLSAADTATAVDQKMSTGSVDSPSVAFTAFPDDTADQPYTNSILSIEDTLPVWNLELSYTGSRSTGSPLENTWTTQATRAWHRGAWEPSLEVGWSRSSLGHADTTLWHLGTGIDWSPAEVFTASAAADWAPVEGGKDDGSARLGLSGSDRIWPNLGIDGAVSGTWERIARGDVQVAVGIAPDFGWTQGRFGASYDRKRQSFLDAYAQNVSQYRNVWGWSAQWVFHHGKWSTGPAWYGDYWKANASPVMLPRPLSTPRAIELSQTVPANGKVFDQVFLWNLNWAPLSGIAFSVDAFQTTGGKALQQRLQATPLEKATLSTWAQASALPPKATGARAKLSIAW